MKLNVTINLNRIRSNLLRIRAQAGVKVMLMVKADAYGHGLCEVALAVQNLVDAFGVATLEEGLELRQHGVTKDILVLALAPRELYRAIDNGLVIGLANGIQLDLLEQLIEAKIVKAADIRLHIALDTGMHRLGFDERHLDTVIASLKVLGINIEGVYSHLRVRSYRQIYAFERMSAKVRGAYPNAIRHLAASKSVAVKRLRYDMVRAGISAYEGAMTVESTVLAVRKVGKGEYVSYGNHKLRKATNTAVVFGGYADGANREKPSSVYIRGRECKVLGNVCMDMCIVDCGDFLPYIGERAVLVCEEHLKEISKQRATIDYTVMTCWRGRIERKYIDDKSGGEACGKGGGFADERRRKRMG